MKEKIIEYDTSTAQHMVFSKYLKASQELFNADSIESEILQRGKKYIIHYKNFNIFVIVGNKLFSYHFLFRFVPNRDNVG